MTEEQKAAYVYSQTVCALAEIEAMKAENTQREIKGESVAYLYESFMNIPKKYGICYNNVIQLFSNQGEMNMNNKKIDINKCWWDGKCKKCGHPVIEMPDDIKDYRNMCINKECKEHKWHHVYDTEELDYYDHFN